MVIEQGPFDWLMKRGMDWLGKGRLAKTSGRLHLPGLQARVEVIRDRWGVPHIYAENELDLFFAQGFVHAQDRFFQMDFQRRLVAGRLSEIFGSVTLVVDRWMRVVGMQRIAEQEIEKLQEDHRQIAEAYSVGINAWLKFRHLPVEFSLLQYDPEPWRPVDSLGWSKMMAWMLSANWESELMRLELVDKLGPEQAEQLELMEEENWPLVLNLPDALELQQNMLRLARQWTGPGAGEGVGSNNWVVSGARTSTGKPILANDMHMLLSTPAIWYENHLAGGELNLTGISSPGLPMIISGHNGQVAWGFTAGFADVQDLYEEHLRFREGDEALGDEAPGREAPAEEDGSVGTKTQVEFEFEGKWYPAEVRQEEIKVRFGASVFEEVITTRHGPLLTPLLDGPTPPLALCWTAADTSGGTFLAIARMSRAKNCAEFREALRTWNTPVLNTVYADTEGNIAYSLTGKVPIRRNGEGKLPAPGWSGEYEWAGFIPYEEMPHLYNPPAGYIVTANNHTVGPDYPYYLGRDYVCSDRAERIAELILSRRVIDPAYVQEMQFDQVSPTAQTIAALISRLSVNDPRLARMVEFMRVWDGRLSADSPAAAIYEVLVRELWHAIFEHRLGDLMPRFKGALLNEVAMNNPWGHHAWEWLRRELVRSRSPWFDLGGGETRDDVLRLALERTARFLTERQGPDIQNWAWGRFHQLKFVHILGRVKPLEATFSRGSFPVGGDVNTIWATASPIDRADADEGMVGPPFRFIADLSDLNRSLGLLAPGQSGQVGSPHYDDQVDAWFTGGYHPMLYEREDVLKEQEACLILLP
ncbi:MAG: penicillin acylase family protein [Chloroflexi bacterium]|nr:MAG: penicillin acylase family protein [Chloroflexota bacterium]